MNLMKKYEKWLLPIQAALILFAVQLRYDQLPGSDAYKSKLHYLYAMITDWFGKYNFGGLLLFVAVLVFLWQMRKSGFDKRYKGIALPCFFSLCLVVGKSYAEVQSSVFCFGSIVYFVRFITAAVGYFFLIKYMISLLLVGYDKLGQSKWSNRFANWLLGKHCFRNVFFLLLLLWAPVIFLSYPGNLCYDVLGQIEQGLGMSRYTAHHPLFHTLIVSGMIRIVSGLTGSMNLGLFAYILLQAVMLAAALAGIMARLNKRGISLSFRCIILLVYLLSPMYSNIVSTAIKDVPFMAAVVWYILLLEELVSEGSERKNVKYWVTLVLVQTLTGLLRNNGIYMVVISGIGVALYYGWKYSRKEIGAWKQPVLILCCLVILPFVGYQAGSKGLSATLHAESGSKAEMFSIPFQQTARYLQLYRDTLTAEEKMAIENVLGDVSRVAERYNPDISDPVKALYRRDAGMSELAAYFKVWASCFFRHPGVYFEAFFIHVYGWFDPAVCSAIRYEAETDLFRQGGLIPGADKVLLFVYRFAEYIPFLAVLENVGFYTWLLFILAGEAMRKRDGKGILLLPLFVSLLICMASPCFYLHPRYAFPIMFTLPFIYGVVRGGTVPNGSNIEKSI